MDCNNFTHFINISVQTSAPGRKLMVDFDPADSDNEENFEIIFTPFCESFTFIFTLHDRKVLATEAFSLSWRHQEPTHQPNC